MADGAYTDTPIQTSGPGHRLLIAGSIMAATIMQVLDSTIANVALPHMQGSLSATREEVAWVLTSYIVAAAIITPPTGWLAARFSRKRLLIGALVTFTLASMLCGAAQSLDELVVFRIIQGMAGAAFVPLSQSILLDTYPRRMHGQAMAMWGMGIMLGPILGPTIGGWLTETYNWRWVFYINVPVGIVAVLGTLSFVPRASPDRSRPFDWFGFILLSVAIGSLQLMLDRGSSKDWFESAEIVFELGLSIVGLYMFLVHMLTSRRPFLEPELFRDRNLVTALSFIFCVGVLLLATMALLPPFLQNLSGYPVVTTGFVLAPRGVGTMISMMIVGRLISRMDPRPIMATGLLLVAASLWWMSSFTADVPPRLIAETGLLQGLGLGLIFVPLSTLAYATLDPRLRTEGSSMFSLMRNLGSSIGISIMFAWLSRQVQVQHAHLGEAVTPYNAALETMAQAGFPDPQSPAALQLLDMEVNRQAALIGYLQDFQLMAIMSVALIPMLLLLRTPKYDTNVQHEEEDADYLPAGAD